MTRESGGGCAPKVEQLPRVTGCPFGTAGMNELPARRTAMQRRVIMAARQRASTPPAVGATSTSYTLDDVELVGIGGAGFSAARDAPAPGSVGTQDVQPSIKSEGASSRLATCGRKSTAAGLAVGAAGARAVARVGARVDGKVHDIVDPLTLLVPLAKKRRPRSESDHWKQVLMMRTWLAKHKKRNDESKRWLVNPVSKSMYVWDFVTTLALAYTAFVTPLEVRHRCRPTPHALRVPCPRKRASAASTADAALVRAPSSGHLSQRVPRDAPKLRRQVTNTHAMRAALGAQPARRTRVACNHIRALCPLRLPNAARPRSHVRCASVNLRACVWRVWGGDAWPTQERRLVDCQPCDRLDLPCRYPAAVLHHGAHTHARAHAPTGEHGRTRTRPQPHAHARLAASLCAATFVTGARHIWTSPGSPLDHPWTTSGSPLDNL
jgi:hypothetical protein